MSKSRGEYSIVYCPGPLLFAIAKLYIYVYQLLNSQFQVHGGMEWQKQT